MKGGGNDPLDLPNWDLEQLEKARVALNTLASLGLSNEGAFGTPEQVDPVNFLIFAAVGWGGLPNQNTVAFAGTVEKNDGTPYSVTAKNVPVDAFWSVTVYTVRNIWWASPFLADIKLLEEQSGICWLPDLSHKDDGSGGVFLDHV